MEWLVEGLTEPEIVMRLMCSFIGCIAVARIASTLVGPERKAKWFKKYKRKYFLLNKRGFLGEECNFGRPRTKEGVLVALAIVAAMMFATVLIFKAR